MCVGLGLDPGAGVAGTGTAGAEVGDTSTYRASTARNKPIRTRVEVRGRVVIRCLR
jgi:hypothetical protein